MYFLKLSSLKKLRCVPCEFPRFEWHLQSHGSLCNSVTLTVVAIPSHCTTVLTVSLTLMTAIWLTSDNKGEQVASHCTTVFTMLFTLTIAIGMTSDHKGEQADKAAKPLSKSMTQLTSDHKGEQAAKAAKPLSKSMTQLRQGYGVSKPEGEQIPLTYSSETLRVRTATSAACTFIDSHYPVVFAKMRSVRNRW